MRTTSRWFLLGAIAAAGLLAVIVIVIVRSGDRPAAQRCSLVSAPSGAGPVPDSSGVKIAERGFTTVLLRNGRYPTTFPRVSIGAVLENTTGQVAYRTRVVFDALGPDGASVVSGVQVFYRIIEVPILMPGARVAIGNTVVADERSTVTRVTIDATVNAWLPVGGPENGLAPVIATTVASGSTREDDGSAHFAFTTQSSNCVDLLSRGTTFALRNASGAIVGGNTDGSTKQDACRRGGTTHPWTAFALPDTVPASADLSKTEITALCDIARKSLEPRSRRPIN